MSHMNKSFNLTNVVITVIPEGKGPITVGGAESLSVNIRRAVNARHEAGNHKPVELVDGKFDPISFSLTRAYIDVELLKELGYTDAVQPYFEIHGDVVGKEGVKSMTLIGCKLQDTSISGIRLDGYTTRNFNGIALDFKEE